jgi:hypothetical protein
MAGGLGMRSVEDSCKGNLVFWLTVVVSLNLCSTVHELLSISSLSCIQWVVYALYLGPLKFSSFCSAFRAITAS